MESGGGGGGGVVAGGGWRWSLKKVSNKGDNMHVKEGFKVVTLGYA